MDDTGAPTPEVDSLQIANCTLLDAACPMGIREGQHISIAGNTIRAVSSQPDRPARRTIQAQNLLAIPGLVNAHTHSPECLVRATSERMPLEPWLFFLFSGLATEFDDRQLYLAAALNALEMIRMGATSVLDHLWMNPAYTLSGLDAAMEAYRVVGLRAAVAPMVDDLNPLWAYVKKAGLPVDDTLAFALGVEERPSCDQTVALLDQFMQRWHGAAGGRLRAFAGTGNVLMCTADLWRALKELVGRHHTGLHTHAVETRVEATLSQQFFGKSAVRMLDEKGVLGPEVSLAHCVWLDPGDLERLAARGATLVHNPASNLKLGSGLAPIPQALELGVNIALGADGSASSDNQSLFEAMKLAALIHNPGSAPQRWPSAAQALHMATKGGARAMGLEGRLGDIAPGMLADIALLDLNTPLLTPLNDPCRQLVFCENGSSVRTVVIDGQVVLEDGQIRTVDEQELLREVRERQSAARKILRKRTEVAQPYLEAIERLRLICLDSASPSPRGVK